MSRLRSQQGFTLVELLMALTIGVGVLLAAYTVSDATLHGQTRIADRSDAIARGRTAMEQIVQQLRSEVCLGPGYPAIAYGDSNHITFYADLANTTFTPQKRDLSFAGGALTETTYAGSPSAGSPPFTFAVSPTRTRVVLDHMQTLTQAGVGVPFFRYYSFDGNDPIRPSKLLAVPLSATDAAKVVQISVAFGALPSRSGGRIPAAEPFNANVYVRTADPTDPDHSPLCI
jgi:prepilin-type N-terminal cleavage/methylation domain-containing protein